MTRWKGAQVLSFWTTEDTRELENGLQEPQGIPGQAQTNPSANPVREEPCAHLTDEEAEAQRWAVPDPTACDQGL